MSKDGIIELWELRGKDDCRYSTFAWRTRLALLHKGLTFEVHPVHVSDKEAIAFSGQDKVPVIRDGGHVVSDSWKIAVDLERAIRSGRHCSAKRRRKISRCFSTCGPIGS